MPKNPNPGETGGIPIGVRPDVSGEESGVYDVMFLDQSSEEVSLRNLLNGIEQQDGGLNPADIYFDSDENLAEGFKEFQRKRAEAYIKYDEVLHFFKDLSLKMPSKNTFEPHVDEESLRALMGSIQPKENERTKLIGALMELGKDDEHYRTLVEERYNDFKRAVAELETSLAHLIRTKDDYYVYTTLKKEHGEEYKELEEMLKRNEEGERKEEAGRKMAAYINNIRAEINKELKPKKEEVDVFKRKLSLIEQTVKVLEIYQRLDQIKLKRLQEIANK